MRTCFKRVRSASTKHGTSNWGKVILMPRFWACGSIMAWHSQHDLGQRGRLQRQRQLAGLDLREIQDFVDQLQQIPSRVKNLIDAGSSGRASAAGSRN